MLSFPRALSGKESAGSAGDPRDAGSVPGLGRSPGGGNGNPLQYSCLGNPMDRGAQQGTVHGVAKESDMTERLKQETVSPVPWNLRRHSLKRGFCGWKRGETLDKTKFL